MSPKYFGFNWKMNPVSLQEIETLSEAYHQVLLASPTVDCSIFAPFIYLSSLQKKLSSVAAKIGSQDCFHENRGASTGQISSLMLGNLGLKSALIGHSETRHLNQLSDEIINLKILSALENGLEPVFCIGYSKESELDINLDELQTQLEIGLQNLDAKWPETADTRIIIAYEPVWAIGTGKVANFKDIYETLNYIKNITSTILPENIFAKTKFIYGGSVNGENFQKIGQIENVDGFLIGGASLKPAEIAKFLTPKL